MRKTRKVVNPRIKGTKREAADMIRKLSTATLHNEFSHDFETQAKKCEKCKLLKRAAKLADKLEEVAE